MQKLILHDFETSKPYPGGMKAVIQKEKAFS